MRNNNDTIQKTNIKLKNKKIRIIIFCSILIAIVAMLIVDTIKKETTKYAGIEFHREMDINNINLIVSSDESPIEVPVPKGFVASSVESERTVNGGFVIYEGSEKVTEANLEEAKRTRNQYIWIPIKDVSDMYHISDNTMYGAYYTFSETGYKRGTRQYEPNVITDDKQVSSLTTYMNGMTREKFLKEIQQSFKKMIESVGRYGGFYIGRYETGNLSQNIPVTVKMNLDIGNQNWYDIYKRSKRVSGSNANIETNMIWGIQFDETLKWLIDTGCKTNEEVTKDSTSWGNYQHSTFQYTNTSGGTSTKVSGIQTRIPTGSSDYTKANNIYDLAGNVWDWSMEGDELNSRYWRGGGCYSTGAYSPAHHRYVGSPYDSLGSRRVASNTLY